MVTALQVWTAVNVLVGFATALFGHVGLKAPWYITITVATLPAILQVVLLWLLRRPSRSTFIFGAVWCLLQVPSLSLPMGRLNLRFGFAVDLRLTDPPLPIVEINLLALALCLLFVVALVKSGNQKAPANV